MDQIRKVLFAFILVLSGVTVINYSNSSIAAKAEVRENVGVMTSYSSLAKNTFRTTLFVGGNSPKMADFTVKHTPTFSIKKSDGMIVKQGSLNTWVHRAGPKFDLYELASSTNVDLSALSPGNYRIYVSIPMDDGAINSAVNGSFTQAFTLHSDHTVTNIRP